MKKKDLVFDHDPGHARVREALHSAPHVEAVAVSRVPVRNARNPSSSSSWAAASARERPADLSRLITHLAKGEQPRVRKTMGRGDAETRHERERETGTVNHPRGEPV